MNLIAKTDAAYLASVFYAYILFDYFYHSFHRVIIKIVMGILSLKVIQGSFSF